MVIKESLDAPASADGDEALLRDLKTHVAEKLGLKKSLTASEKNLADAERCIQLFEYNKDTLDELAIKFDEAWFKLKTSKENLRSFEDKISEQSSQMTEKDSTSSGYRKCVVVLKWDLASALANLKRFTTQHTADKDLLDGVRMAFCFTRSLGISAPRRILRTLRSYFLIRSFNQV